MTSDKKVKPPEVVACRMPTPFWHVDREMLRFKIHFFLFIGALSAAIPFVVVFAKVRLGLSPSSLGAVLTAQMFLIVFTKPLIGYIADYFNRLKSIIVVLTLICASCFFCLLAIPKFEHASSVGYDATLCRGYEDLLTFRDREGNFSKGNIDFVKIRNETSSYQLFYQYANWDLNVTDLTSLELVNSSYDQKQQELDINSERIVIVVCYRNHSVFIRLCSCAANSSSNSSKKCSKIFCSNTLNFSENEDNLNISSALDLFTFSQNLTVMLNQSSFENALTNIEVEENIFQSKDDEIREDSYERRQQELIFNNERIFAILSYKNDSTIIRLCSCAGKCSSNNSSNESSKIFCSSILISNENRDYLNISSPLNLNLTEKLNQCSLRNTSTNIEEDGNNLQSSDVSDFQTMQFWIFAFLFSLSSICANATFTLSDTACCESIQKTGADFGRQRMWGSVGWGLIAPIAGFLNDTTGDFLDSWLLMAAMLLLFLWNLSKLDLVKPNFSTNILGDVGTVLKSREFLAYEVVIFMNGVSTGMIWFYLIWFLTSIGGSELLCGLCIAVQCFCGAIPFMFFSGWVIRKVGCFQILSGALLTYVVRFLWYSYLYNPWWVLPIECCHGVTYGLYYTVLAHYGKKSSKPGTEATTQSVLFSTHEGLGAGLGCVLAGIGFDYFGGHETFFAAGMFCACGFIISLILFVTIIRKKKADDVTSTNQPHV